MMAEEKPDTQPDKDPRLVTRQLNPDTLSDFLARVPTQPGQTSILSGLQFYLPRNSQPVIIENKDVITIGRKDSSRGILPVLDLTPYGGADLGVSRFHAEIVLNEGKYYIKDMGSTNGTWVNDKKVDPYHLELIKSGDQLRLGYLPMVIKYFSRRSTGELPQIP